MCSTDYCIMTSDGGLQSGSIEHVDVFADDTGTLALSLGYTLNKQISFSFDALNLNDPILKYYGANESQPRAFYANGRQFYFGVRFKL